MPGGAQDGNQDRANVTAITSDENPHDPVP
jgi:hypothetical protein